MRGLAALPVAAKQQSAVLADDLCCAVHWLLMTQINYILESKCNKMLKITSLTVYKVILLPG